MIDSSKYVTVFCDASFCHKSGIGGWAGWVKFGLEGHTLRISGVLRHCPNSTVAEKEAIAETIKAAQKANVEFHGKIVTIQSDCLSALGHMEQNATIERMLMPQQPARLSLKHVKGHRGHADKRSSVNTWCDRQAKKRMREARDERI